jgi:ubiquinone biosynthesis monooxygenase Coq7
VLSSFIDKLVLSFDNSLKTLSGQVRGTGRPYPVDENSMQSQLLESEIVISKGQMRINHTGEVCAQALYHAQSLFCRSQKISDWLLEASLEEQDHLLWCHRRLTELKTSPSIFNPFFYGASFLMGSSLSLISDKLNLGFIRATEDLVCEHLIEQKKILTFDKFSLRIISQMIIDEKQHSEAAEYFGGFQFSPFFLASMRMSASVMKTIAYTF